MTSILLELAVGTPDAPGTRFGDAPAVLGLDDARRVALAAESAGLTAVRLPDAVAGASVLDPTVVAGYLAAGTTDLGYVVDVPTTHHAPYNLARRVLSFDRAAAGSVGLALRPGDGDEVSAAVQPDALASDRVQRWAEHASILTRLWESFPREALVGDQENAIVADDSLIRPIAHVGRFYRVAGPLDGPASVQARPVLVADLGGVPWDVARTVADVVVVDDLALVPPHAERDGVVVLARRAVGAADLADPQTLADVLTAEADRHGLDGFVLAPRGAVEDVLDVVEHLVPLLAPLLGPPAGATLRERLGTGRLQPVREGVA